MASFRLASLAGVANLQPHKDRITVADQKNQKPGLVKKNWQNIARTYALK